MLDLVGLVGGVGGDLLGLAVLKSVGVVASVTRDGDCLTVPGDTEGFPCGHGSAFDAGPSDAVGCCEAGVVDVDVFVALVSRPFVRETTDFAERGVSVDPDDAVGVVVAATAATRYVYLW